MCMLLCELSTSLMMIVIITTTQTPLYQLPYLLFFVSDGSKIRHVCACRSSHTILISNIRVRPDFKQGPFNDASDGLRYSTDLPQCPLDGRNVCPPNSPPMLGVCLLANLKSDRVGFVAPVILFHPASQSHITSDMTRRHEICFRAKPLRGVECFLIR